MSIRVTETKAGKKRYAARVHLGGGKYKLMPTRDTRKEAREDEARWELSRKTPDKTLGRDFAQRWLAAYKGKRKLSSYKNAESKVKHWLKTFGNRSLQSISREEAQEWAANSPWACNPIVTMMNEAVDDGLIERNPFRGLTKRYKGRRDKTPLTVAEIEELAEVAQDVWADNDMGERMKAFVLFTSYSGMRVGEIFALEWNSVDFDRGRIKVKQRIYAGEFDVPKSGRPKEITLLPEARQALEGLDRSGRWVFTSRRGAHLTQAQLGYYWRPIRAAFGRYVTPHELRHFLGHYLYVTKGFPARVVAAQLTHSSPSEVERLYGHGDVGALEEIERTYEERSNVVPLRRAANG
jgi:integrase